MRVRLSLDVSVDLCAFACRCVESVHFTSLRDRQTGCESAAIRYQSSLCVFASFVCAHPDQRLVCVACGHSAAVIPHASWLTAFGYAAQNRVPIGERHNSCGSHSGFTVLIKSDDEFNAFVRRRSLMSVWRRAVRVCVYVFYRAPHIEINIRYI